MKQPSFQFYTGDFKKDPQLSICSPATRGIWMDFLCTFYDANVDRISGTPRELSRLCRCLPDEMESALSELTKTNAADVEDQNGVFTVICRRLRRKQELSKIRANSGAKKSSSGRSPEGEDEEVLLVLKNYAVQIGLPASDGEACFHKWQGNGWTNGGQVIKCWQSTMRSWKDHGYMPSLRQQNGSKNGQHQYSKQKEKAPIYPKMSESREPTQEEIDNYKAIGQREVAKLREELGRNEP